MLVTYFSKCCIALICINMVISINCYPCLKQVSVTWSLTSVFFNFICMENHCETLSRFYLIPTSVLIYVRHLFLVIMLNIFVVFPKVISNSQFSLSFSISRCHGNVYSYTFGIFFINILCIACLTKYILFCWKNCRFSKKINCRVQILATNF